MAGSSPAMTTDATGLIYFSGSHFGDSVGTFGQGQFR